MIQASEVERDILELYHQRYSKDGFPKASDFLVLSRNVASGGTETLLDHPGKFGDFDGELFLGNYSYIQLNDDSAWGNFSLMIDNGKISKLLIMLVEGSTWDKEFRNWDILVDG